MSEDWQNDYDWGINRKLIHKEKEQGLIMVDQTFFKSPMERMHDLAIKIAKQYPKKFPDLVDDINDMMNPNAAEWYSPLDIQDFAFEQLNQLTHKYYFALLMFDMDTTDVAYVVFKREYAIQKYGSFEKYIDYLKHITFDELELF